MCWFPLPYSAAPSQALFKPCKTAISGQVLLCCCFTHEQPEAIPEPAADCSSVQSLNPTPFVLIAANCAAWVGCALPQGSNIHALLLLLPLPQKTFRHQPGCRYAYIKGDPFVFMANDPGLLSGLFLTVSAYGLAGPQVRCPSSPPLGC